MPVAIVTGGNSGIGRAICVALADAGFDVGLTWHEAEDRMQGAIDELRGERGVRVAARQVDLHDTRRGAAVVQELADELGGVDVFVSNAGQGVSAPVLEMSYDEWCSVLDVNLNGAFLATQAAARLIAARDERSHPGRIVVITSVHEHVPLPQSTAYVASKHALGGMVKNMALELAEHGITVNAVAPGEIATRMTGQEDVDPRTQERPRIPAGRPGDAHEVAAVVRFLASEHSAYVTGASWTVDGGLELMAAVQQ